MDDDNPIALSALSHYLYCPRRCGLIHVDQLWAESYHTAQGRLLHERVDEIKTEKRRGIRSVSAMPLAAPPLGIAGIADMVEFHSTPEGERAFPVEYKRGRPNSHRADEVQLCAQALCLEHMLAHPIPEGALYYGQTRRRTAVAFDAPLRELTLDTIAKVRAMLESAQTPSASYAAKRCDACSMLDLCQPKLLQRSVSVRAWLQQQLKL
jgi:CRISPR-associated exonuclease Cas4